jgi:hypothetical protein
VLYVGHPVDPPVYLPVAQFHTFLFEHKIAEALCLLRCLGAVTVNVVRVAGWDQDAGLHVSLPIPGAEEVQVGAAAGQQKKASNSIMSTMQLHPTGEPYLPTDLVWLPHEPLWQEVAQARLESGLTSFVLDVKSEDDYGVNASLKVLVAKSGLDAGGSFVEHRSTNWRLEGTFETAPA